MNRLHLTYPSVQPVLIFLQRKETNMPVGTQHRGGAQPDGAELLGRILKLETALGIQGSNPQAFFAVRDAKGLVRVRVGFLPNCGFLPKRFPTQRRLWNQSCR